VRHRGEESFVRAYYLQFSLVFDEIVSMKRAHGGQKKRH
jgi:hypothetical protein